MGTIVQCPQCGSKDFDLRQYDSLMVLSSKLGLFGLRCPRCSTGIVSVCVIPAELEPEVRQAAQRLGAGMGQGTPSR